MKVSEILRTAMAKRGIKTSAELSKLTGVNYCTVIRAINDENVGVDVLIELLDHMQYKLKAEATK